MNNKVYIAGRITGDPNYRTKFKSAEAVVKEWWFFDRHGVKVAQRRGRFGFEAVNPAEFTIFGKLLDRYPWRVAMAVCLFNLLGCSHVYMLKDWKDSRGAQKEHKWAKFFGKEIIYQ